MNEQKQSTKAKTTPSDTEPNEAVEDNGSRSPTVQDRGGSTVSEGADAIEKVAEKTEIVGQQDALNPQAELH